MISAAFPIIAALHLNPNAAPNDNVYFLCSVHAPLSTGEAARRAAPVLDLEGKTMKPDSNQPESIKDGQNQAVQWNGPHQHLGGFLWTDKGGLDLGWSWPVHGDMAPLVLDQVHSGSKLQMFEGTSNIDTFPAKAEQNSEAKAKDALKEMEEQLDGPVRTPKAASLISRELDGR